MLAIMLEISASMTQLNTRVYAILETQSIKKTGADIWRQRFHSVYENIRLRPSTRGLINGVFKFIHFGERSWIYALTVSVFIVFVWTEGLKAQKSLRLLAFAFTIVFVWTGPQFVLLDLKRLREKQWRSHRHVIFASFNFVKLRVKKFSEVAVFSFP